MRQKSGVLRDDIDNNLAEVHHRTVDVDPPVLLVPLDRVEVPTARFVDGAGEVHGVPGPRPHLVPQPGPARPREEGEEEEGAEEQCWGDNTELDRE